MNAELSSRYEILQSQPETAPAAAKQQRGRDFEVLLCDLLREEGLQPRLRYRPNGEEIDASLVLDGRVFLLEAKWHKESIPASELYRFKGKVDGKLVGTIGIFVSMSGFSSEAVSALTLGKDLNVLLFDRRDVNALFKPVPGPPSFATILRSKIRFAAESGVVNAPYITTELRATPSIDGRAIVNENETSIDASTESTPNNITVVCEGPSDQLVLGILSQRILESNPASARLRIVPAGGKVALTRIADALYSKSSDSDKIIFVVDGDDDPKSTEEMIQTASIIPEPLIVVIRPELETWITKNEDEAVELRRKHEKQSYIRLSKSVDLSALQARDAAFKKFAQLLRTHSTTPA